VSVKDSQVFAKGFDPAHVICLRPLKRGRVNEADIKMAGFSGTYTDIASSMKLNRERRSIATVVASHG